VRKINRRGAALVVRVLALIGLGFVLSACLGPGEPDPTGRNPFGSLDRIVADGDGVRLQGWTIDPSTSEPVVVTAWRDGKRVDAVADLPRPDVGAAYPGYGDRHGFDFRVPNLPRGRHTICAAVDNVGPGEHTRVLGCGDIDVTWSPYGRWDVLSGGSDGRIRMSGWAYDPDAGRPVRVGAVLDGAMLAVVDATPGFSIDAAASPGWHDVCLVMGNAGHGSDTWLGCQQVYVPPPAADRRPVAALSAVEPTSRTSLRVSGIAADPDTAAPLQVRLRLTGPGTDRTVTVATGAGGAFTGTFNGLGDGAYKVCPTALDAPTVPMWPGSITGDRVVPCGSAVLGLDGLGTTGEPTWLTDVAPPAGHPNARVERDGGVSVQLFDGNVLWVFGDSLERDAQNRDLYFRNNTAALGAAGSTTITRDAVVGGAPVEFVTPSPSHAAAMACPADKPVTGLWPMSASAGTTSGSTQRVVLFFANICLGGPGQFEDRGVSVVEWTYVAGATTPGTVLRGQILTEFLFGTSQPAWGTASWTQREAGVDVVYGYDCESPAPTGGVQFPNAWGPCTVGRVPAANAHLAGSWTWWNGTSWSANRANAAPMAGIPEPSPSTDSKAPVAALNVAYDPNFGRYLMSYSPWPGYTNEIFVRVARTPVGPWSEPVTFRAPGCDDSIGSQRYFCYAGASHVALSGPGNLGLGFFDQLVAPSPPRGAYRAMQAPFVVAPLG
jgi:hypothetical protein